MTLGPARRRLGPLYAAAVYELRLAGGWSAVPRRSQPALALITAWNPDGRARTQAWNRAADRQLRTVLARRGLRGIPARGRDAAASWCEPGWAIPHRRSTTLSLLRRFRQLAALVSAPHGLALLWRDGVEIRL